MVPIGLEILTDLLDDLVHVKVASFVMEPVVLYQKHLVELLFGHQTLLLLTTFIGIGHDITVQCRSKIIPFTSYERTYRPMLPTAGWNHRCNVPDMEITCVRMSVHVLKNLRQPHVTPNRHDAATCPETTSPSGSMRTETMVREL